jgi:hypothetical protein
MGRFSFRVVLFGVGEFFVDVIISGIFFGASIAKNATESIKVSSFEF